VLLAATTASGCSTNVDGTATCPGCGNNAEPEFPTSRPTVSPPSSPTATAVPPTIDTSVAPTPPGDSTLTPTVSGYVYIETKSGLTRCQLSGSAVGCESDFTNAPSVNGQPANGVEVTSGGSMRWISGNLGAIPTVTLDYAVYHAVGWTIDATSAGTRFTNEATGHGMFISTEGVSAF
jgi:hypothetical protein